MVLSDLHTIRGIPIPSTSKKQHNLMDAVANNPEFAAKAGIPQSVGKDFSAADKKASRFQSRKSKFYKKAKS